MKITGKLIGRNYAKEEATIEVSPPTPEEIANLKEGDEVLVGISMPNRNYSDIRDKVITLKEKIWLEDIVAILPHSALTPKAELLKELEFDTDIINAKSKNNRYILGQIKDKINQLIKYLKERER